MTSAPATSSGPSHPGLVAAFMLAVAVPALLAVNVPPSSTFLNQAAALIGWGIACAAVAASLPMAMPTRLGTLAAALLVLMGTCVAAVGWRGLPSGLGLSALGLLAAALLTAVVAAASQRGGQGREAFRAFAIGLVAAAVPSVVIAVIQYFVPQWADGDVIARAATPGRVGANLRQANHLSSLLLAAVAALVWLHEDSSRRFTRSPFASRALLAGLLAVFAFGLVLTVSRTGSVCVVVLALWGVVDRRLSPFTRRSLWVFPFVYALMWAGLDAWAAASSHAFAGDAQLHKADLSSSRFGVWSNTWSLMKAYPAWGVGWGEFNFAWTLTPFPGRPIAFFDHTHNLPLHFAVELGWPVAFAVLALLVAALVLATGRARHGHADDMDTARCGVVMVLMMGIHSLLEYPLWYAYFLLPTVFAFAAALGARPAAERASAPARRPLGLVLASLGALLVAGAAFAVHDFFKVVRIFAPGEDAPPLEARIEEGRGSVFFAHHAEYAAVTTAARPSTEMRGFDIATHYLLDARLMVAWSKAFAEQGDLERGRYVAQRLKEFRHPIGDTFFAECKDTSKVPLPFQCTPPTRSFTYKDFLPARAR